MFYCVVTVLITAWVTDWSAKSKEKCAATQLVDLMDESGLSDPLQSTYRPKYSTESVLITVTDDIMNGIDS